MNTKHTAGPWKASFKEMGGYDCITDAYEVTTENGEHVALIDLRHYEQVTSGNMLEMPSTNEARTNARLIAAAPELLEVLREISAQLSAHPEAKQGNSRVHFCMHKARAALAKAEGKATLRFDDERTCYGNGARS